MDFMTIDDWLTVITVLALGGMGLLITSAFVGIVMTSRTIAKFPILKGRAFFWHQWITIGLGVTFLLHSLLSLITNERTEITLLNILVPFTAAKETIWLGLGSIALYMLIFTIITSLTVRKKHQKVWRYLHYGTYLALTLGLVHGLFISSNFKTDWKLDFLDAEKVAVELFALILAASIIYRIKLKLRVQLKPTQHKPTQPKL